MTKELNPETVSPFEKFQQFTKKIISVPKAEIDRREQEYKKAKKTRRRSL